MGINPWTDVVMDTYLGHGVHGDEDQVADMQHIYNDYLIWHGRPKEVNYLDTPDIDRWRNELEEMAEWLDLQDWPQPQLNHSQFTII